MTRFIATTRIGLLALLSLFTSSSFANNPYNDKIADIFIQVPAPADILHEAPYLQNLIARAVAIYQQQTGLTLKAGDLIQVERVATGNGAHLYMDHFFAVLSAPINSWSDLRDDGITRDSLDSGAPPTPNNPGPGCVTFCRVADGTTTITWQLVNLAN